MNISWDLRRSTAARRVFALLLLAATLPVGALALLCSSRLSQIVTQQAQVGIVQQARAYGAATLHRLGSAEHSLRLIAAQFSARGAGSSIFNESEGLGFDALAYIDGTGQRVQLHGLSNAALSPGNAVIERLARNDTMVLIAPVAGAEPKVILVRKTGPPAADAGVLIAEINQSYLWGARDAFADTTDVSVVDESNELLFSTKARADSALPAFNSDQLGLSSGQISWNEGKEERLGGYWKISLRSRFSTSNWTVLASQPRLAAFDALSRFGPIYAWVLLLCVLIAALLATVRLRRKAVARRQETAIPGTEEACGSDARAGLFGRDDAGLEESKNKAMAVRFERQFRAMTALSEIDRAILSHATFDHVVESVLRNAPNVISSDLFAITLLERDAPTQARTFLTFPRQGQKTDIQRTPMDASVTALVASRPDGCWVEGCAKYAFLTPLMKFGATRFLVLPVFWDGKLAAMLVFGLIGKQALSEEECTYARDFADRLGVALTAAAREEELKFQAHYDVTTALPNRRFFKDRLSQEIGRARRESRPISVLFIDLDEFKKINDSIGHAGGDEVLEQASRRLTHCLRADDIVARFGGDEFAVLLPSIAAAADAAKVAEKLITNLSRPYVIDAREHYLSASIGISVYPEDGESAEKLLRNADFAMYRAKAEGRGQYAFYEERMNALALDRAGLELDLRHALSNNELMLYYQPQIDLRSGQIVGAEALVRWKHPKRGFVLPADFIGVAEQCALIEGIGLYVRKAACAQYRAWESSGLVLPRVSVNVSSREINRKDFVEQMEALLRDSGVRPFCLEIEITESLFIDNFEHVLKVLKWLNNRGIRIAIDDFGTGYSSMAYLKRLPFDTLKVDRSFVKDIGNPDGSDAIVAAILSMAQSLRKEVVAEGVETEAQRAFLALAGCEAAQGYLWSRPLSPEDFEKFARNWTLAPRQSASTELRSKQASG